jgi:O-antigen ligase/polysaccharide polymerase Wzy-like membrane protein
MSAVTAPAVARVVPLLALTIVLFAVTWQQQGSLAAGDWLPLAIVSALLLVMIAAAGAAVRPPRLVLVGTGALLALAGWTAASMAWSASPSGARDEALLVGLYLIVMLVPVLALVGRKDRGAALGVVVAGLAVLGVLTTLELALSSNPATLLFGGRLNFPVSYVNACSALFVIGFWPAVVLAAQRGSRPAARAAASGAASLFLALAIAAQSKGTVLGLVVSALLVFALAPTRLRLLGATLIAALPAGAAVVPLTAPYRSAAVSVTHRAGWTAVAVFIAGAAVGTAYALTDRRLELGARRRRLIGRSVLVLVAAGLAAGFVAFFVSVPAPGGWVAKEWASFKHKRPAETGSSHLTALGSNRYDFWRVTLDEAAAHPLRGIGARGFYSAYLQHRRSEETPLRAHSLYLDVLAELGIPGLFLLLVGVGTPLVLVARRLSQPAAVAGFGAATYFFAHAAVDWIWTVPVVGGFAFLFLGIGCASVDGEFRPLPRRASIAVAVAAFAAALLAFAPPWLSHRYVLAADSSSAPAKDLSRARWLDPLSLDPYWAAWSLATTNSGRIDALEGARRLEPRSVAVLYQLGLVYLQSHRRLEAADVLRRAHALDPREQSIRKALLTASR